VPTNLATPHETQKRRRSFAFEPTFLAKSISWRVFGCPSGKRQHAIGQIRDAGRQGGVGRARTKSPMDVQVELMALVASYVPPLMWPFLVLVSRQWFQAIALARLMTPPQKAVPEQQQQQQQQHIKYRVAHRGRRNKGPDRGPSQRVDANICPRHERPRRQCHTHLVDRLVSSHYWCLFQWTCDHVNPSIPSDVAIRVARAGHVGTMRWLHRHKYISDKSVDVCYAATKHGHRHAVEWCISACGMRPNRRMLVSATSSGCLELVKWLHDQGCRVSIDVTHVAAHHGHLDIVQWADALGCPWTRHTAHAVAKGGHLHVIQWASQAKECPWRSIDLDTLVAYAAQWKARGIDPIPVLELFVRGGCQTSGHAMKAALLAGDLGVIKWVHAQGFPFDSAPYLRCVGIYGRRPDVREWLLSLGDAQD